MPVSLSRWTRWTRWRRRPRADLLRLDGGPDPFALLLDRSAEHDAVDRLRRYERQPLSGLIFAGRNDQRLHAGPARAFLQRQEQGDKTAAVDHALFPVN